LIQIFLDDNCEFARLERVEVDGIANRNLVHLLLASPYRARIRSAHEYSIMVSYL
jgi:hypothetical protein